MLTGQLNYMDTFSQVRRLQSPKRPMTIVFHYVSHKIVNTKKKTGGRGIKVTTEQFLTRHNPSSVCVRVLSCVQFFETQWTVGCQALRSMGFSQQEYWSGLPFFPPGDLPDPGMEPRVPLSPAL